MSESPHITFMLQYTEPNVQYVDYTNRTEAVELENELNLENQMQKMGDITEERVQEIKRSIPEQGLDFKDYVEYMNRSYATEGQNETMTAIFTQETNYLQKVE
ncbi:hypothetical protein [Streptococcus sp. O1]|uniref:hypothetical protein n=1 Tax=Streptococcus sp. O1 TaxID=2928735 RepID=UPI00277D071F|nr:hypothetical protein [Streptococcus sp. O1]